MPVIGGLKATVKVEINWIKSNGYETCINNCPISVFELENLLDYSNMKKPVPVRAGMECVTFYSMDAMLVSETL